jgi:23S rRNA pseudouridine2457 synthase
LIRVAIAHLSLQGLAPGQWRSLNDPEIKMLYQLLGLNSR